MQRDMTADSSKPRSFIVCSVDSWRFSRTSGLFFYCAARNFLLMRLAFFWASFIKVHAVFGLFSRKIFLSKSIVFVNFAKVVRFVFS